MRCMSRSFRDPQLNQNLARVGGYFRNAANTDVELLIADSTTFGLGTSKMLTVRCTACTGDFNSDGFVDDNDFQIFVVAYDILTVPTARCPWVPGQISRGMGLWMTRTSAGLWWRTTC